MAVNIVERADDLVRNLVQVAVFTWDPLTPVVVAINDHAAYVAMTVEEAEATIAALQAAVNEIKGTD